MTIRILACAVAVAILLSLGTPFVPLGPRAVAQGPDASTPLDVILIVDQSKSMFIGSDPGVPLKDQDGRIVGYETLPIRQNAAGYFVDYLSVETRGLANRVGVVYFDRIAETKQAVFDVTDDAQRERVVDLLFQVPELPPPERQWTDLRAALQLTYEELFGDKERDTSHRPMVLLLSDGHPELAFEWPREDSAELVGKDSYYASLFEIVDLFTDQDCPVFPIVIALGDWVDEPEAVLDPLLGCDGNGSCPCSQSTADDGGCTYADLWRYIANVTGGEYYRASRTEEVLNIYHAIVAKMLGVSPLQVVEGTLSGDRVSIPIAVDPYCERLILTVEKTSADTTVRLMDPGGEPAKPERARSQYELFSIENPMGGNWMLEFQGGRGSYRVRLDCAEGLAGEFLSPPGRYPLCKPMLIQASLTDKEGTPVSEGWMGVKLTWPNGNSENIPLASEGDGIYSTVVKRPDQLGDYQLHLTGRKDDTDYHTEKIVSLVPMPYLDFVAPLPIPAPCTEGGDVIIEVSVKEACEPAAGRLLLSGKDTDVTATLVDSSGLELGPYRLRDDGEWPDSQSLDGIFGELAEGIAEGEYTLLLELRNDALPARDAASGQVCFVAPMPPPRVGFGSATFGTSEREPGLTVSVVLSTPSKRQVTVRYATSDGTATAGTDYVETSGALTFSPGDTLASFTVQLLGDIVWEGRDPETFLLVLSDPDQAELNTYAQATVSILEDDEPPTPEQLDAKVSLVRSDLGAARAGDVAWALVHVDAEQLLEEQEIVLSVDDGPFHMEPVRIYAQPGRVSDTKIEIRVSKAADPQEQGRRNQRHTGTIRVVQSTGRTDSRTFEVEVLPPANPWPLTFAALGVVATGGGVYALYWWRRNVGVLTGRFIYVTTPAAVGSLPDEELHGQKQGIVLDEPPDLPAAAADSWEDEFGAGLVDEFTTTSEPSELSRGARCELSLTARRRHKEAQVAVQASTGLVLLNDVPILPGQAPQLLRDGDTIRMASYTLQYETPLGFEPKEGSLDSPPWAQDRWDARDTSDDPFADYDGWEDLREDERTGEDELDSPFGQAEHDNDR